MMNKNGKNLNTQKSLKINFIYKFSMLFLNVLFPLVSAPYVSRILGADNLGKVYLAQYLVGFVITIASIGIPTYGIREISKVKNNKERLSKITSEIVILSVIFAIIFSIIYLTLIFTVPSFKKDSILFLVFGISLALNFLSLDWFYSGIEEFGYIALRNLIIKVISFISLFVFVRNSDDYLNYGIILVFTTIGSYIFNLFYIKKHVKFTLKNLNLKKHLIQQRFLMVTLLMGSIYSMLDQVLVGMLSNTTSLALYSRARQIGFLAVQVTSAISIVMLPRLSFEFNASPEHYKNLINRAFNIIIMISLPVMFGLLIFSKDLMILLGGIEFLNGYTALNIIAVWTFIVAIAVFTDNQIFIPMGKEKYTTIACIMVAFTSLSLNLTLIPRYDHIGAAISILVADLVGLIIQVYFVKKVTHFKFFQRSFIRYIIATSVMFVFLIILKLLIENMIIRLFLGISLSIIIYFSMLIILDDTIVKEEFKKAKIKLESLFK